MNLNKFKPQTGNFLTETSISSTNTSSKDTKKEEKTTLYTGEVLPKYNRSIVCIGTLDELISYIGVIKSEYMIISENKNEIDNSSKLFVFARLTQIQETLIDIQQSIGTIRKRDNNVNKFLNGEQKIKELENEISLMPDVDMTSIKLSLKDKPLQIIAGTSLIESRLLHARSICRKCERQLCLNEQKNLNLDKTCLKYLNKLSDYLLALSIHLLHIENKEPAKKAIKLRQSNLK